MTCDDEVRNTKTFKKIQKRGNGRELKSSIKARELKKKKQ